MKDTNMVIDDSELYIPEFSPVCTFCRHALPEKRKCKAFSGDIPLDIWNGENDHTKPVDGDNGIQFEQVVQP